MYESLRPTLNDMSKDISCIKSEMTNLSETINQTFIGLSELMAMKESSSLSDCEAGLSHINGVISGLGRHLRTCSQETAQFNTKLDSLNESIMDNFTDVEREVGCINNTANNICNKIEEHDTLISAELLRMKTLVNQIINNTGGFTCGGTGGWRRGVYLDMTDPNTKCPSGWNMTGYSKRTCGRASTRGYYTCNSVFFPVDGGPYTQVCGMIRAYQWGQPDAFFAYNTGLTTIDSAYFSGVTVMHGTPRQHIWIFAAGKWENGELYPGQYGWTCPCNYSADISIPPFVGDDYFCESGYVYPGYASNEQLNSFHSSDVLWDGRAIHVALPTILHISPKPSTRQLLMTLS